MVCHDHRNVTASSYVDEQIVIALVSSHITLADHNRKEPIENIYTNIILGNNNVLSASNVRKSVHTVDFCGSG